MTRTNHPVNAFLSTAAMRVAIAIVVLAGSAAAQMFPPQEGDRVAQVPFSFLLGDVEAPAGEYLFRRGADGSVLLCEDGVYCTKIRNVPSRFSGEAVLYFVETSTGPRFAGLDSARVGPYDSFRIVRSRRLQIHRNEGLELSMVWK